MYSSQYDPLPGVLMLLALAFLCGACTGIALGYRLALHRRRQARPVTAAMVPTPGYGLLSVEEQWLALRFHRDTVEAQNRLHVTDEQASG